MAPEESNGHVTDDVTWPRQVEVVTPICWGPLPKIWLEIRIELWLHVTLNFYTYTSFIYIRIEISYECYRWHWTDSVFFRTLSCCVYLECLTIWIVLCNRVLCNLAVSYCYWNKNLTNWLDKAVRPSVCLSCLGLYHNCNEKNKK